MYYSKKYNLWHLVIVIAMNLIFLAPLLINNNATGYYQDDSVTVYESEKDMIKHYSDQVPDPRDAWVSMKMQWDLNQILKIILIGGGIIFAVCWIFGKF